MTSLLKPRKRFFATMFVAAIKKMLKKMKRNSVGIYIILNVAATIASSLPTFVELPLIF